MVNGQERFCERSRIDTTCAVPTPTPTPTPECEPTEPRPNPCCQPKFYQPNPNLSGRCLWNCNAADYPTCEGERLDNGCYLVSGPVVCEDVYGENFRYRTREDGGQACCPTPTPTPDESDCHPVFAPHCDVAQDSCGRCPQGYISDFGMGCCIATGSPVLVDPAGDGFRLTDAPRGVLFDLDGTGRPRRWSWTEAGSDDAWLALDRDGNGRVDSGQELFGNFTEQPEPPAHRERNGFLALAEYDQPSHGGHADGVIDRRDAVFASLRLWRDVNHDGVSQPGELFTLASLGVARLHLDYREAKKTDAYGNAFRYRAKVDDAQGVKAGRWAWDVFLVAGQ